jgi:hypothetical protein
MHREVFELIIMHYKIKLPLVVLDTSFYDIHSQLSRNDVVAVVVAAAAAVVRPSGFVKRLTLNQYRGC